MNLGCHLCRLVRHVLDVLCGVVSAPVVGQVMLPQQHEVAQAAENFKAAAAEVGGKLDDIDRRGGVNALEELFTRLAGQRVRLGNYRNGRP